MNTKTTSMVLSIFALTILSLVAVSAADFALSQLSVPSNVSHDAGSFPISFNVSYTGTTSPESFTFSTSSLTSGQGSVNINGITLTQNQSAIVSGTVNFNRYQTGTIAGNIIASNSSGSTTVLPFSVVILNSHAFTATSSAQLTVAHNGTIAVTNTGNLPLNLVLNTTGSLSVSLSSSAITNLLPGATSTITVSPVNPSDLSGLNTKTVTININDLAGIAQSQSVTFSPAGSFCSNGNIGNNLTITDLSISNSGSGDESTWNPLDNIKVTVEVTNANNVDVRSVEAEIGLIDSNGINRASKLIFTTSNDQKASLGTIKEGDSKRVTFEFQVPGDMKEDSYKVVAKAYSKSTGQSLECADTTGGSAGSVSSAPVTVQLQDSISKYIAFDNVLFSSAQATCGDTVTLNFNVWNIGTDNQDQVKVNVVSSGLGLSQSQEITNGLDSGNSEAMTFTFQVPASADNKIYPIKISADYDYSDGAYGEVDTGVTQTAVLTVFGCSSSTSQQASIAAALSSSAQVGQEMTVTATITNTGNTTDFIITPTNFDSWAQLVSVTPQTTNIPSGTSKQVTLTFKPTQSGTQSFIINAIYNGKTLSQPVQVSVSSSSSGFSFAGLGNTGMFIIAAVLIILIIVVIVLIVKAASRSPRSSDF